MPAKEKLQESTELMLELQILYFLLLLVEQILQATCKSFQNYTPVWFSGQLKIPKEVYMLYIIIYLDYQIYHNLLNKIRKLIWLHDSW